MQCMAVRAERLTSHSPYHRVCATARRCGPSIKLLRCGMCLLFIIAALACSLVLFLLSSDSIDSRILGTGSVGNDELMAAAVTTEKIHKAAITSEKLDAGTHHQRLYACNGTAVCLPYHVRATSHPQ